MDFSGAYAPPTKLKPKSLFEFSAPSFDDSTDIENTHTTGESPTNAAYVPTGSQPTSNPTVSSAYTPPGGVLGPNIGQNKQPNLVNDIYAPRLRDVTDKLESAYAPPQVGGFRSVLGALLSSKHPAIGGLISGETQRQREIQPLQQEYGLLTNAIGAQRAQQLQDAQIGNYKSEDQLRQSQIEAMKHPKPVEEEWSNEPNATGPNGEIVQTEKHSGQVRLASVPGMTKTGKPTKIAYDTGGIPVSVTGPDNKTYDINDPALPSNLKPLVTSAQNAHAQHLKEQEQSQMRVQGAAAASQARVFANQEKMFQEHQDAPTAATKTMIESVPKVKALIARLQPLVDAETQGSGPLGARWSDFWNNKMGAPNPQYNKMRVDDGLLATALMKMHFGSKGGELVMQHFSNLLGLAHQSPQNYKAALEEINDYANDVGKEGHGGPNPSNLKDQAAPATGGGKVLVEGKDF